MVGFGRRRRRRSVKRDVPAHTRLKQQRASDPRASAWVSAHAGSGKTHVLAQRVVRLLLEGVKPEKLICLTFTKAAAANMSERVFRTLARWALADDDTLRREIADTGAAPPDDLDIARRLFARAVETPGGLKIQTIHAFCERVLHLFPFEANIPADFRVVEDLERLELLAEARAKSLNAARGDAALGRALARVASETWDGGFDSAVDALLGKRDLLRDADGLIARLPAALGLAPDETEQEIERRIVHDGIPFGEWTAVADVLALGKAPEIAISKCLTLAARQGPDRACIATYLSAFFIDGGEGTARKNYPTKDFGRDYAALCARLSDETRRLEALRVKLAAARARARSAALIALAADIFDRYRRIKQARALLDFDDLIGTARRLLLQDGASQWALYKLDGGVDHILVDEAQDTSEAQWDILRALATDFSAGAGARAVHRTFFAVGDEKQSIFSFQGAAPAEFDRNRRAFEKRVKDADGNFEPVTLDLSFRSAVNVLKAVDHVFADEAARRGLTATPDAAPRHIAFKNDVAGMVELWPPLRPAGRADPQDWVLPLDLPRETDPPVELARRIADRIAAMTAKKSRERISGGEPGTARPITPGDVMILVRRRGAFFEAMVRALKERKVPVAGADRLDVGGHIAVMDMVAAARTALLPADDLTLACVLKSPLCELGDDDLIDFAPKRPGSLWDALSASGDPRHRAVAARIEGWRRAARSERPFDFFHRLLAPEGGRKAFVERMGPEVGDALDELLALALAHERQEAPSLLAFVHALETIDLTVKRDMEAAGGLVRVMTAHASKGLEAPIVFLPDTCSVPAPSHDPVVFELEADGGRTLVWSPRKADDAATTQQRRAFARQESDNEYRRLLYVAMTRAEERLYIAGYVGSRGPAEGCWRNLVERALREHCTEIDDPAWPEGKILRFGEPLLGDDAAEERPEDGVAEPAWLRAPALAEASPAPPLRPSNALAGADRLEHAAGAEADAASSAARRGAIVHALLQNLPDIPPERRRQVATRYVRVRGAGVAADEASRLADEAVAALDAPDCAPLFAPRSRAEVGIAGRLERRGGAAIEIVGRIDRVAEVGDEIWIADFKTGAPPAALPDSYVAQLALYRAALVRIHAGRVVRAFILWTAIPRLDEVASTTLEAALERL
jgi:ATP-dependent helicase/nuclease subunit A